MMSTVWTQGKRALNGSLDDEPTRAEVASPDRLS